jgi:hypothetical protein
MNVEYYYPNQQELLDAIRTEFQFLVSDYGFAEPEKRTDPYPNPYSVLFRKAQLEIVVEGHSYGGGTAIEIRISKDALGKEQDSFWIGWLTQIRRPDLLEPEFPDKRGQLLQLPKLAHQLKVVADDLLHGDLSILPQVRDAIAKARAELGVIEGPKENETKYGAFMKSNFLPWCGSFVNWVLGASG